MNLSEVAYKIILFSDIETIVLNVGLNNSVKRKCFYGLFDMIKNRNLSLVINTERGQLIALSDAASLFESSENDILHEL